VLLKEFHPDAVMADPLELSRDGREERNHRVVTASA
jgi:hypothetical protein